MKTLPSTDVVIIGGGWTGLPMAKEPSTRTPVSIVVLERGRSRQPEYSSGMDELDYFVRLHMMQDPSRDAISLRHDDSDRALPIRQFGAFLPGSGVGGTGEHWGAVYPRLMPDCFELYSKTVEIPATAFARQSCSIRIRTGLPARTVAACSSVM